MRPNRTVLPILLAAAVAAASALAPAPAARAQVAPTATEVVERYVELVLNRGRHDLLPELVAADKVAGFRKALELRRALFPDIHYRVEETVAQGDRVVVRCTVSGHHVGDEPEKLPGGERIPPSGRWLEVEEALFYTVEGGEITSGEIVSDQLGVVKALGFTVVPPEGYEKREKSHQDR